MFDISLSTTWPESPLQSQVKALLHSPPTQLPMSAFHKSIIATELIKDSHNVVKEASILLRTEPPIFVLEAVTPPGGRDAQLQLHYTSPARLLQCQ